MDDNFVTQISDNVYLISEFGMTNCFLIVGKDQALLIDTGNGIHNIRKVVEKITSLPIKVVLSHGHPDHAGGAIWFSRIYMNQADSSWFYRLILHKSIRHLLARFSPAKQHGIKYRHLCPHPKKWQTRPLNDGDVFELGRKTVRAIHTPGHTKGSMVFLLEQDKLMFTGDNVCPEMWMFLPGATSIEEWLIGAEKIYDLSAEYQPYNGHCLTAQSREQILSIVEYGKAMLQKNKRNSLFKRVLSYPAKETIRLIYRTDKRYCKKR